MEDATSSAEALGTAVGGAAGDPTVKVVAPIPNLAVLFEDPDGNTVTMVVDVLNATVGPTDYHIQYFLDGVLVEEVDTLGLYDVVGIPFGRHHLAARLVTAAGETLPNKESLAGVYVKVIKPCNSASPGGVASCEDGLQCSAQACTSNQCNYGPVQNCCDHDLECAYGWICVDHACLQCTADEQCADANPCTNDYCALNGKCVNEPIPGCCFTDADCDDKDVCTTDTCNAGTCEHADSPDELCCNTTDECVPEDPCQAFVCYHHVAKGIHRCRFGPGAKGCCTDNTDCNDGNPCTLNLCNYAEVTDPVGKCAYEPDGTKPNCCIVRADCDDGDLSTLDKCDYGNNECSHAPIDNYCELPATSVVVINEIMASPGVIADGLGEWIELYNPSSTALVDLSGWTIETSLGDAHTFVAVNSLGGLAGMMLPPYGHWVAARSGLSSQNGGFTPNYAYGSDISLPDFFEDGASHVVTLTVKDKAGEVVDEVTYDTDSWPFMDSHTLELTHPNADNALAENWAAAGTNKNPMLNLRYGKLSNSLFGSPKNSNRSSDRGILHPSCVPDPLGHPCAEGRCGVNSLCTYPLTPGCCAADVDCNDYDNCTVDVCNVAEGQCADPVYDPQCCTSDADCNDGNPCNMDRCLSDSCRHSGNIIPNCCNEDIDCSDNNVCTINSCDELAHQCEAPVPVVPDLPGQTCCNNKLDCDDADPATLNLCDPTEHVCMYVPDPNYCDDPSAPCDDGVFCTEDSCDVSLKRCQHLNKPGCCQNNESCPDDDNACTVGICNVATGECSNEPVAGCCLLDPDCDDGDACTEDLCTYSHKCHNLPIASCCNGAEDCDDGLACTLDGCFDHACTHDVLGQCCTPGASGPELVEQCGPDPDGAATCFQWECSDEGQCDLIQNATCCAVAADCNDGDGCTIDFCQANGTCKHVPTSLGDCCVKHTDCTEQDGNLCTVPFCNAGTCDEMVLSACLQPVDPPIYAGPEGGVLAPFTPLVTGSCWVHDEAAYLGPDTHAECFGDSGVVGPTAILQGPGFDPTGADSVSVQFAVAWVAGAGLHSISLLATSTDGDFTGAETLAVIPVFGDNPGTTLSYSISNAMLAKTSVYLGWRVDSDTPANLDISIDDVIIGIGHAPFFVSGLNAAKTYDPVANRLEDGGTVTASLGSVQHKLLWAHDIEWATSTLDFELIGAPDFVTLSDVASIWLYGISQAKIRVAPTASVHIGTYDMTVRVTDGVFYDEARLQVVVNLGEGYVLYAPEAAGGAGAGSGAAASDAADLGAALTANGAPYQLTTDLGTIADWSKVKGLFITVGGASTSYVLTDEEVAPVLTYLDGGGNVYLEGSATWANDPQTALHSRFRLLPNDFDAGIDGAIVGVQFMYPKTFAYTTHPEYNIDVDGLVPVVGSGARIALLHTGSVQFPVAVAAEEATTTARLYGTSLVLSRVVQAGSTAAQLIGSVLDFFAHGFVPCDVHAQCNDGDLCTEDKCVGGYCQNNVLATCDLCESDADCEAGLACKPNGACVAPPGTLSTTPIAPADFNCDTTDERMQVVQPTHGFETIYNANVHVALTLGGGDMSKVRITLSHNGKQVTLVEPTPGNTSTFIDKTFDQGGMPAVGHMNYFDGQYVEGPWVLTVEDTDGGEVCHTVTAFDVYLVTSPVPPTCANDEACDNGQFCDGVETCVLNVCQAGTAEACDDSNPCSSNVCDPGAVVGAGACDHTGREQSCAGDSWACGGAHKYDAGDDECGIYDACIGGASGGSGVCSEICPGCTAVWTGRVDTAVQDFHCATEIVEVVGGQPYVEEIFLKLNITHPNLDDLTVRVFAPNNSGTAVIEEPAGNLVDVNGNFYFSVDDPLAIATLCSFAGTGADGLWKIQVCDGAEGNEGTLDSAVIYVRTVADDPTIGQDCTNPIVVPTDDATVGLSETTKCYNDSTAGGCTGDDGHDVVYSLDLPDKKRVQAELYSPDFNGGVYFTQNCGPGASFCADGEAAGGVEALDVHLTGGTWFAVVDAIDQHQWGNFQLNLTFVTLFSDGVACDEHLDCYSGHCQNGFCCGGGDCCYEASDCPMETYTQSPQCDDNVGCQGHRVDATCIDAACGTIVVEDDTACDENTESSACGLFDSTWCTAELVQSEPPCMTVCDDDAQCDDGVHCYEGAGTADEALGTYGAGVLPMALAGGAVVGQPFVATWSGHLASATIHAQNDAGLTNGLRIDVVPGGAAAELVADIESVTLATTVINTMMAKGDQVITFTPEPLLTAGQTYSIVVRRLDDAFGGSPVPIWEDGSHAVSAWYDNAEALTTTAFVCTAALGCQQAGTSASLAVSMRHADSYDCRLDLGSGLACFRAGQCESEACADGVCCNTACTGLCSRCDRSSLVGTCSPRVAGSDPDNECAGAPGTTCDGTCDGAGACSYPAASTVCGTCIRCDGAGWCTSLISDNTDPDDSCPLCEVCTGKTVLDEAATCDAATNCDSGCRIVPSGNDPLSECDADPQAECGQDGFCNGGFEVPGVLDDDGWHTYVPPVDDLVDPSGTAACRKWLPGTICFNETCATGYADPHHRCDGAGTCTNYSDIFCEGHQCAVQAGDAPDASYEPHQQCAVRCDHDGECVGGYYCEDAGPSAEDCLAKLSNGTTCDLDHECNSNWCTDVVCCDESCGGPCKQCNLPGKVGECQYHNAFTDPESGCGLYWCDGLGACKPICVSDADCKAGNWCNGTACEPKKANGTPCSGNNQCVSEACNGQDGVCCNVACTGECESCVLPSHLGECTLVGNGDDPNNECNGTGTCGGTCDGAGHCQFPPTTLGCATCKRCDGDGTCVPVVVDTDPDNTCGLCQTCNGNGGCKNVPYHQDIHDDCTQQPQSGCGFDGYCDGNALCDYYGAGTVAIAQSCSEGIQHYDDKCDGSGGINDGGTLACLPYVCGGTACLTACSGHADCASGYFCDLGDVNGNGNTAECLIKRNNGETCNNGNSFECLANHCQNGYCCANGDCCASNTNCSHLAVAAVCDTAAGCDGHRIDAFCDGNKSCYTTTVDDDTACATLECVAASCSGLTHLAAKQCDSAGGCSVGGTITSCDDANDCTDNACNAAAGCQITNNSYSKACYTGPAGTLGHGNCDGGTITCSGGAWPALPGGCVGQVVPGTEVCGGGDEDCDDASNEEGASGCTWYWKDTDNDTWGDDNAVPLKRCFCGTTGEWKVTRGGDCNDAASGGANQNPDKTELCGTAYDDNCSGVANEDGAGGCVTYYYDGDNDGYGTATSRCACASAHPYDTTNTGDCADSDPNRNPGRTEVCNAIDDDCDGKTDTADRSALDMCGAVSHGTPGCPSGTCIVASCEAHFHNLDGAFSNGCEGDEDPGDDANTGDYCGPGNGNESILGNGDLRDEPASTTYVTGNIVPAGDVDSYKFLVVDSGTGGKYFRFDVRFDVNPGSALRFSVAEAACGTVRCASGTTFEKKANFNTTSAGCTNGAPCGNQNCHPTNGANHCDGLGSVWWYVNVFHPSGTYSTSEYKLKVTNGVY